MFCKKNILFVHIAAQTGQKSAVPGTYGMIHIRLWHFTSHKIQNRKEHGTHGVKGICKSRTARLAGRLPITFPCHAGQLPVYYNQIRGQHGNRYADLTQDPAFAFGEGEGYTTFAYGEPTIVGGASNADGTFAQTDTVHAEIALTNTGRRAGTEVVQAYVGDVVTSYSWADRELKAFRRVTLEPGETATVVFDIPVCDCTIADADANRIVEPGEFELLIGHSSRRDDLKRTTFTVA